MITLGLCLTRAFLDDNDGIIIMPLLHLCCLILSMMGVGGLMTTDPLQALPERVKITCILQKHCPLMLTSFSCILHLMAGNNDSETLWILETYWKILSHHAAIELGGQQLLSQSLVA